MIIHSLRKFIFNKQTKELKGDVPASDIILIKSEKTKRIAVFRKNTDGSYRTKLDNIKLIIGE